MSVEAVHAVGNGLADVVGEANSPLVHDLNALVSLEPNHEVGVSRDMDVSSGRVPVELSPVLALGHRRTVCLRRGRAFRWVNIVLRRDVVAVDVRARVLLGVEASSKTDVVLLRGETRLE